MDEDTEHQARWETQPLPVQHSLHPHTEIQMISNFLETEEATRSSDTLSCPTATEAKFKPTAAQKPQVYTAFPNLPMQINNATGSWRRRHWCHIRVHGAVCTRKQAQDCLLQEQRHPDKQEGRTVILHPENPRADHSFQLDTIAPQTRRDNGKVTGHTG